jgi:hypothetical protein
MSLEKGLKLLLGVLVLLVIGSILYSTIFNRPALILPAVRTSLKSTGSSQGDELLLEMLTHKPPLFKGVQRNVFEFGSGSSDEPIVALPGTPGMAAPPIALSAAAPAGPEVRYLAYYRERESGSARLAAIVNGGQIFVGGVGDVLADRYKILEINEEYLILQLIHEDNRILRLPLGR